MVLKLFESRLGKEDVIPPTASRSILIPIARLTCSGHLSRRRQVYVKSSRPIEQPNRTVERRRTRVHVPLRHAQFPVSRELVNRSRRCTAHRQGEQHV